MALAATEGIDSLVAADFSFVFYETDSMGAESAIKPEDVETYLNLARCQCEQSIKVRAVLSDAGKVKLGTTAAVNAELKWGKDCLATTANCTTFIAAGKLTNAAPQIEAVKTVKEFFAPFAVDCGSIEDSASVWLLLKNEATPLTFAPAKLMRLDTKPPAAPVLLPPTSGEGSVTYGWTHPASSELSGFQALCSPLAGATSLPEFSECSSVGLPNSLSSIALCSKELSNLITSQTLYGFTDGTEYKVGMVAIDKNGNVSEASNLLSATPAPTRDFFEIYKDAGGKAEKGCQMGAGSSSRGGFGLLFLSVLGGLLVRRRKPFAKGVVNIAIGFVVIGTANLARADSFDVTDARIDANGNDRGESEREFNLSFGVGFYKPQIDKEFSDKGLKARPYDEVFKGETHALWQLRFEKILWRKIGTLTLGFGAGHFLVEEKALTAAGGQSSDNTSLRVIPLSLDLGYQLDTLVDRGWGLMPYVRAGLDDSFWYISDAKSTVAKGSTTGWHAAAGLAFAIDALDPDGARQLDRETGVNHTLFYVEYQHQALTGLGSKPSLNLSDSMWALGLILQM